MALLQMCCQMADLCPELRKSIQGAVSHTQLDQTGSYQKG